MIFLNFVFHYASLCEQVTEQVTILQIPNEASIATGM